MLKKLLWEIAALKNVELNVDLTKEVTDHLETKANEVEHTTNTGYGKELVPVDVLSNTVMAMVPTYGSFINAFLVGFQGNWMGASIKVPIKGEIAFAQGVAEWTTGAGALIQGTHKLPTDEVTITQFQIQASVDISRKLVNHSVADLISIVTEEMSKSFARTIESAILNADPNTSTAGNINSDDQAAATTFAATGGANDHRLLGYYGLRQVALAGSATVDYLDVGSLDIADFFTLRWQMGLYSIALQDLVLIMDYLSYNKALGLSEFLEWQKNGKASTVITGAISNIAGVDLFVSRDFPKTKSTGKANGVTTASNVKWGFLYAYRPSVQRGFGQPLEIDVVKVPGKGYQVIGTMEFGFTVVNKKATVTDPAVVLAIDVS